MQMRRQLPQLILLVILVAGIPVSPTRAQDSTNQRPIDMMIVIDNSCSMFPKNQILAGCDASGNDPEFLRIVGADLFIARLGYSEPNEADYRMGIIGMGDAPELIADLLPVIAVRTELAKKIANPKPQPATRLIPALKMAYDRLSIEANRGSNHTRAVVMVTDGIPWPAEGQANADIQALVAQHPDIPLFMMLLKNPDHPSRDFDSYIKFWETLSGKYEFVNVSLIENTGQIIETYNQILGQLQGTVAGTAMDVGPGNSVKLTVSPYSQRLILTVIRKAGQPEGAVTIKDPQGKPLSSGYPGWNYFHSKDNPVEVHSVFLPGHVEDTQVSNWTIVSNIPVTLMVDLVGVYQINFANPQAKPGDIAAQFIADGLHSPNQNLPLRILLVDSQGRPVSIGQTFQVKITAPDQKTYEVVPAHVINPDNSGVFEIPINLIALIPGVNSQPGRYAFTISAGLIDPKNPKSAPVAIARLLMDFGAMPFIRSIAPLPLICQSGQPAEMRVSLGDVPPDQIGVAKLRVFSGSNSVWLTSKGEGIYRGDVSALCENLVTTIGCSATQSSVVSLQLESSTTTGMQMPTVNADAEVNIIGGACTPTPLPKATSAPTPTAAPPPDRDLDGVADAVDRCPEQAGWQQYQGCLPWSLFAGGAGGLLLIAFLGLWVWPVAKVNYISPPPDVYLLVCREGDATSQPVSIRKVGLKRHTTRISIGSSWLSADIRIEGVRQPEYYIEWQGGLASLRDPADRQPFAFFTDEPRIIRTSDPKTTLRIGTRVDTLSC
ncbi:MAG: VWA domain-containing protein [Anaerolineaceae bacterium]|nr:VWA domain-containing protein [Anaerolineaceae bacterium]